MRHAMGVAVFSGMLGVTFFGLVLTPVFYVVIQGLVERRATGARQFAIAPAHDEDSNHA
jgi:multidrug efflux pump